MSSYSNIEQRKNFDGSRTGYDATGRIWRITGTTCNWKAIANVTVQGLPKYLAGYDTLQEISDILKDIK